MRSQAQRPTVADYDWHLLAITRNCEKRSNLPYYERSLIKRNSLSMRIESGVGVKRGAVSLCYFRFDWISCQKHGKSLVSWTLSINVLIDQISI